jgi:hypothetical protein
VSYTQSTQKVLGTTVAISGPMYDMVGDNYDDDDDDDVHTDSQSRLGVSRGPGRAEESYATRTPRSRWQFLRKYTDMMLRLRSMYGPCRLWIHRDGSGEKGSFDCRVLESTHSGITDS